MFCRPLFAICLSFPLLLTSSLFADFTDGVEDFDGTTLDTTTWESRFSRDTASITQDDELMINNPSLAFTDYVTRTESIRVGDFVRVEATLDSYNNASPSFAGVISLIFTDDAGGDINGGEYASLNLSVSDASGARATASRTGGTGLIFHNFADSILGQDYILELERLTASGVRYSLYDFGNNLIADRINTMDLPEEAFIALSSNGNARFDNVAINTIVTVPEPTSSAILLGVFMLGVVRHRRRS